MFKKIILVALVLCVYSLVAISARPQLGKVTDLAGNIVPDAASNAGSGAVSGLLGTVSGLPVVGGLVGGLPGLLGGLPIVG